MVAAGLSTQCSMHRQLVDCSSRINSSRHCSSATPSSLYYSTSSRRLNSPSQGHLGLSTDSRRPGAAAIHCKLAAGKPPAPAAATAAAAAAASPVLPTVQMEDLICQQLDRLQQELQEQPFVRVDDDEQRCERRRERWDAIPLWQSSAERDAAARAAASAKWSPLQRVAAAALDAVEERLIPLLERRLPSTADPAVQLKGNFAPVAEQPARAAKVVQGQIPECLHGCAYIRNGANPRFRPSAGHHLFDGDGMLHSVSFTPDGGAAYCARFTRTARLCEEERLGRPIFPKAVGELHGHGGAARLLLFYARAAAGIVDASHGMGPANAGVVFFDGKLLAMSEDDQPYAVRLDPATGDLSTVGRYDFGGQLAAASMIAHPKRDSETGELFALSYDVVRRPYLRYFSFASDGTKQRDVEISLPSPTMMHDFAITSKYVVVPDQQVVFQLPNMLRGMSPVVCDSAKTPRFGVLPRDAQDESGMRWVDVPDCFCFHVWNAWEEVDAETGHEVVVVLGSCMTPPDCVFNDEEGDAEMSSVLCEIRLDLVSGTSTRRPLAEGTNLEAGTVNSNLMGRKTRYLYLAVADPWPMISGVAKVDTQKQSETGDCVVGKRIYGDNCYGGEPFFVPRTDDPNAAEDDGYVLTLVHNESTDSSELLILDAATDNLDVVARVQLPSRVPYGFHGTFLSAKEVASQH